MPSDVPGVVGIARYRNTQLLPQTKLLEKEDKPGVFLLRSRKNRTAGTTGCWCLVASLF